MRFQPGTPVMVKRGREISSVAHHYNLIPDKVYIVAYTISSSTLVMQGSGEYYNADRFEIVRNLSQLEKAIYGVSL